MECETIANQQFYFWLRPMVNPATWPTGWPQDKHNFYTDHVDHLATFEITNPAEEMFWPGPRLIPEGACFHCEMGFFGEEAVGFIGEFAPGAPLPTYSPYRWAGYSSGEPVQGMALGLFDSQTLALRR